MTRAPGTAALLTQGAGVGGTIRRQQLDAVLVGNPVGVSRAPVNTFVNGGGHPGYLSSGAKNGECIDCASSTAYERLCVLSVIPPDWNPAVIELPIAT